MTDGLPNHRSGNRDAAAFDALNKYGGGVYFGVGSLITTDATIDFNTADSGGGLYQVNGTGWTLGEDVSITSNTPDDTASGGA